MSSPDSDVAASDLSLAARELDELLQEPPIHPSVKSSQEYRYSDVHDDRSRWNEENPLKQGGFIVSKGVTRPKFQQVAAGHSRLVEMHSRKTPHLMETRENQVRTNLQR